MLKITNITEITNSNAMNIKKMQSIAKNATILWADAMRELDKDNPDPAALGLMMIICKQYIGEMLKETDKEVLE